MLFRSCALVLLVQASFAAASLALDVISPFVPALPKYPLKGLRERSTLRSPPSPRPLVTPYPHTPERNPKVSPPRNQTCFVNSHNDGVTDDAPYILEAIQTCNNGGHVVFTQNATYIWGTALDLTFLSHIDLGTLFLFTTFGARLYYLHRVLTLSRHSGLCSIHKRHRLLASKLVQANLPKCHYIFPAWRQRCERVRRRDIGWQRAGLV